MIVITQSCLTLYDLMDCSPRLLCPWNVPGKNTGVGCISFSRRSSPGDPESNMNLMSPASAVPPGNSKQASLSMSTHTPSDLRPLAPSSWVRSMRLCKPKRHLQSCIWYFLWDSGGLPRCLSGKESPVYAGDCRRLRFDPWVGKNPWRQEQQHDPVFLAGQRSLVGYKSMGSQRVWQNCAQTSSQGSWRPFYKDPLSGLISTPA